MWYFTNADQMVRFSVNTTFHSYVVILQFVKVYGSFLIHRFTISFGATCFSFYTRWICYVIFAFTFWYDDSLPLIIILPSFSYKPVLNTLDVEVKCGTHSVL